MILPTLMAAALTVSTFQTDDNSTRPSSPVEKQAGLMTYTLLLCRDDLPPTVWDAWLPLAFDLGVDYVEINSMREHIARKPLPVELDETVCLDMLSDHIAELDRLQGEQLEK